MNHELTLELAQQATAMARVYHAAFYCSLHTVVADLPPDGHHPGGLYTRRAAKVWFSNLPAQLLQVVYCETAGDDEALLTELQKGLNAWAATNTPPEDSLWITEEAHVALLKLASHPLTSATDRLDLVSKYLRWQTVKEAREIGADLVTKIEARSPGVLTGRSWMPHGPAVPKPAINPYALTA